MTKKDWLFTLFPLLFVIVVDQYTKNLASALVTVQDYGVMKFALHHNPGAMLGMYSDIPAVLRIVSLATLGAFLLSCFALIQYLLPTKSLKLRSGMSFLIGGIIGNVLDRILYGYVIDFVYFDFGTVLSPVFNLADALQWVGYFLITYCLLREGHLIWPEINHRKKYWVNSKFQLKYCFFLMGIGFALTLVSLVYCYTYLRVTILEIAHIDANMAQKYLWPFVLTFSLLGILFCIILFIVGKVISHRIAGPLYAFERFLDETLEGKNLTVQKKALKLRAGDEFKHLEHLAEEIRLKMIELHKKKVVEVVEYSDDKK